MADRRMFSKRIIGSARFLRMPISSQALYFHLGLYADDDGVVEAFSIMRSIGCTEDDLRVLVAKGFVQVLNDDLVSYIVDWSENNKIRPDRKIDSIYKDLLLQINPDLMLVEKRERADRKANGQPRDVPWTTNGQPMDNQWTDKGRTMDGIGKDRIGEDSIRERKKEGKKEKPSASYEVILSSFDLDSDLKDAIREFIKMRKLIKSPMTNHALELLIKKLLGMSGDNEERIAILNRSIENSWKGIFPLKNEKEKRSTNRVADDLEASYKMMEAWANEG